MCCFYCTSLKHVQQSQVRKDISAFLLQAHLPFRLFGSCAELGTPCVLESLVGLLASCLFAALELLAAGFLLTLALLVVAVGIVPLNVFSLNRFP